MERYLKQVPASPTSFRGIRQAVPVQVDPQRLQAHGVTLQQVFAALARSNTNAGNYIEHGEEQYVVRGLGTLAKVEDIEESVIAARRRHPHPHSRHRPASRSAPFPAGCREPGTASPRRSRGSCLMRRGEPVDRARRAARQGRAAEPRHPPPGVRIDTFYDRSQLVRRTLTTVTHNLVVGALLVNPRRRLS